MGTTSTALSSSMITEGAGGDFSSCFSVFTSFLAVSGVIDAGLFFLSIPERMHSSSAYSPPKLSSIARNRTMSVLLVDFRS